MEPITQTSTPNQVTGLFRSREDAEAAYSSLRARGYTHDDVDILLSDDARKRHFPVAESDLGDKVLEGAGVGSAVGGTIGAIAAAFAAIGSNLVIPGLGLVVAGPIAAALAGAGAGGLTGGVVGALVGAGIPEDRAKHYETGLSEGGIVLGVKPRNREDAEYIEREWKSARGEQIYF